MKDLSKIKNYIYGKGIMCKLNSNSLSGIHKAKKFTIYFSKKNIIKGKPQLLLNINDKLFSTKDSNEIVRLLNA